VITKFASSARMKTVTDYFLGIRNFKMKIKQINLLVLIAGMILSSGCSLLTTSAGGKNSPPTERSNQPSEAPTATPQVVINQNKTNQKTKSDELKEIEKKVDEIMAEMPKGNLDEQLNQANFEKIKEGMSLGEVVKIFADKGMLIGNNLINGRHSLIYMWSTGDMKKRIRVTFEKDKVIEKAKDGF
jgi:hypothetical protein